MAATSKCTLDPFEIERFDQNHNNNDNDDDDDMFVRNDTC